jgi:hypothetical protein
MTQRMVWTGVVAGVMVACAAPADKVWEGVEAGDCIDGADNDEDGQTDCADSDCAQSYDCVPHTETWDPSQETALPESAPTGDADGWDCDDDAWGQLETTGTILLESSVPTAEPLCSGDVFLATGGAVKWVDSEGEEEQSFPMASTPTGMVLDGNQGNIYVARADVGALTVVDLETGNVAEVRDVGGLVVDLSVLPAGRAVASLDIGVQGETYLAVIGGTGAYVVAEADVGPYGQRVASDLVNSQVLVGSGSGLTRLAYDSATSSFTFLNQRVDLCVGELVDVEVSADGAHAVLVCSLGNGGDGTLWDVDPTDLESVRGQWVVGTPELAAFSPDSTKLAATDGTTLYVFDVDGYALAGQLVPDLSACPGAEMRELKWSRGGSILYGVYDCSDPSPSVVTWWVTEGL